MWYWMSSKDESSGSWSSSFRTSSLAVPIVCLHCGSFSIALSARRLDALANERLNHYGLPVLAEDFAQRIRDFTHRGITLHSVEDSGHQIFVASRRGLDSCQGRLDQRSVPPSAQPPQARHLRPLGFQVNSQQRGRTRRALRDGVAVHAHAHAFSGLDGPLIVVGRLLDFTLHESRFNGAEHSAQGVNLRDIGFRAALD